MPHSSFCDRLEHAYQTALAALLAERNADGYWTGELSTSALSTATAVTALALVSRQRSMVSDQHRPLIENGASWLVAHQNTDGGWGDTTRSFSNISTSMLVKAALHITGAAAPRETINRLERYLDEKCGRTPTERAEAIRARYGKDRTFAVPILTTCAIAGFVDWKEVTPLPFELACFPQSWFRFLRLPVVSYALPALIAIGQAIYHHRPPRNPLVRLTRRLAKAKSLRVLETIQPSSGGFLEATPLTSFVTLSLASIGLAEHPVAAKGVNFLVKSVRPDGSWPIDTNLATWVTTLSINALAAAGHIGHRTKKVLDWILDQQVKQRHPYTGADPGGWGWTDLPGSVPDADDTAGALVALSIFEIPLCIHAVGLGLCWLRDLQNRDGGWPTFCRGWGNLPFDRSGSDLAAHALRALSAYVKFIDAGLAPSIKRSLRHKIAKYRFNRTLRRGIAYLARSQRPDGSWLPLWFGNQHAPDDENPTYGTARVLAAYRDLDMMNTAPARRGVAWLLSVQNADGGWGGAKDTPSSIEETSLALEVLLDVPDHSDARAGHAAGTARRLNDVDHAVNKGLAWLVEQVEAGGLKNPAPIGFYFAKLWYFEKLYPIIFAVAALGRARRKLASRFRVHSSLTGEIKGAGAESPPPQPSPIEGEGDPPVRNTP